MQLVEFRAILVQHEDPAGWCVADVPVVGVEGRQLLLWNQEAAEIVTAKELLAGTLDTRLILAPRSMPEEWWTRSERAAKEDIRAHLRLHRAGVAPLLNLED